MNNKKCGCGREYCSKKAICSRCQAEICSMIRVDCNIEKRVFCLSCYVMSFWDSLDKYNKTNDIMIQQLTQTERAKLRAVGIDD